MAASNSYGHKKYEFCIVGSGIGGSTLALKLADQGKEVLILEAGSKHGNSNNVSYENNGREFGLRATTSIQLGGTSNLWHGVLSMLDPIDFQKRDYIPNSGWPITYQELLPFYKEASELYNVKEYDNFFLETLDGVLQKELKKIHFDRNVFYNKLFQQPIPTTRFKEKIIKLCKENNKIQVLTDTTVLEVIFDDNGKSAKAIKIGDKRGNSSLIIANNFIISAGALETPRLLLNSNNRKGIDNKNVGLYLMDHPMGNLFQIQFKQPLKARLYSDTTYAPKAKIKTGLLLKESVQRKMQLPNHCFYLKPSFIKGIDDKSEKIKLAMLTFLSGKLNVKDIYNVVTNFNVVMQILAYKFTLDVKYKYADMFFVTEQFPNSNSRVVLSTKKDRFDYPIADVNWQITEDEINIVNEWYTLVKSAFSTAEYEFTHSYDNVDWKRIFTSAAHHVGTARMASNPHDGVVDKNLKVFGIENLYICDGSVFPTSGNVNSGLTISALACRLADHLRDR